MVTLTVFGDEAGPLPALDGDDPLVVAAIATTAPVPEDFKMQRSIPSWTTRHLAAIDAVPIVALVQPRLGYGKVLADRISQMNTMAGYTRLANSVGGNFERKERINVRNFVWGRAVNVAAASAVAVYILRRGVVPDRVEFFFDQKSLKPEWKAVLRRSASRMGGQAAEVARDYAATQQGEVRELLASYADAVDLAQTAVKTPWDDAIDPEGAAWGLQLADSLASNVWQDLTAKGEDTPMLDALDAAGFERYLQDLTDSVLAPIDEQVFADFKLNTGLPVPIP